MMQLHTRSSFARLLLVPTVVVALSLAACESEETAPAADVKKAAATTSSSAQPVASGGDYSLGGVTIAPVAGEGLFEEAWKLHSAGKWPEAEALYRQFLVAQPDHVQVRFNLAHGLMASGEPREAIDHFQAVLERDPSRNSTHHWLAQSYRAVGDTAAAERHASLYEAARKKAGDAAARTAAPPDTP